MLRRLGVTGGCFPILLETVRFQQAQVPAWKSLSQQTVLPMEQALKARLRPHDRGLPIGQQAVSGTQLADWVSHRGCS